MIPLHIRDLTYYRFASFDAQQVIHGVFSRRGGASPAPYDSLNVGHTVGDADEHVEANLRAIYAALQVPPERVVTAEQVHRDRIATVQDGDLGNIIPETDALISDRPHSLLLLRFADCVPVFLWAPRERVVALVHAGWPGTLQRIAQKTAQMMLERYGCAPQDLVAGIGPSIGPCCFEIGPEVADRTHETFGVRARHLLRSGRREGYPHLDLWGANALQLRELGVERIEIAALCTSCMVHEFFSHRRERGVTGRFAAVMGVAGEV